ncbi:hypothetical protein GCM10009069_12740 [Algimonas arctica]|uniref:Uncharacterized protein n=1 Tax=Algimonas arctica TaxID=1479486 RepID=A0A8J3G1U2_9PROT|nr:hypothetical protein GCM10009069_12740 [Algimonas arctica]
MVGRAVMSLALAAAISAILLLISSQVKRRIPGNGPWLDWLIKGLAVIVIGLVVTYFYLRVTA